MLKLILIAAAAIAIAACTQFERQERAERAKSELIGMSRGQLLECAGQPDRVVRSGAAETLIYLHGEADRMVGEPDPTAGTVQTAPPIAKPWCEATFTLENSRIVSVRYRGQTGGLFTGLENVCGEIVYHCVRQTN